MSDKTNGATGWYANLCLATSIDTGRRTTRGIAFVAYSPLGRGFLLAAADVTLTPAELAQIDAILPHGKAAGDRYPAQAMRAVNG